LHFSSKSGHDGQSLNTPLLGECKPVLLVNQIDPLVVSYYLFISYKNRLTEQYQVCETKFLYGLYPRYMCSEWNSI